MLMPQVETLEELYEYPLLLSPSQIASGIRFPGSQDRLTKFCEKLLSGSVIMTVAPTPPSGFTVVSDHETS